MRLTLSSSAFSDQGEIPQLYTADGTDISPPLAIAGVPKKAKSLALVIEDPDAPKATPFVHWLVYDIPPTTRELVEGEEPPRGAAEGINDFGRRGYAGPKPPSGRHHYVFKLYALDTVVGAKGPLTKIELDAQLRGHVLEKAELVGTYARAA
jgi:Raf kinase inhibitor-like YbhB/YbcL family protein